MSQPDPRSVVRIAIALAALKFKPKDQSTTSYLFDLQSRFASVTNGNSSRDWQTYALELEKQLSTFKAQRDADHTLLSKLLSETSREGLTSDAPPPKKKSKKNTSKDQQDPEWSWHQTRADWSRFLSSQCPSSPSLIAAYAFLKGVLASPSEDHVYVSRLTDAILRVLDTIHIFLFSSPNADPDFHTETVLDTLSRLNPRHIDSPRIAITSPLLMYFLRTAFPALLCSTQGVSGQPERHCQCANSIVTFMASHANIDRVLDRFLECVLLPLLRALAPLCFARFAPLAPPFKRPSRLDMKAKNTDRGEKDKRTGSFLRPPKNPDARTDTFALIGTSLEALDALPSLPGLGGVTIDNLASSIRDRLALETIRELETLYAIPLPHLNSSESFSGPASASQQPAMPQLIPSPLFVQPHSQTQSQGGFQQSAAMSDLRMKRLEKLVGSREERVRALATRDAGWFLASTLNLCVTPTPMPTARTGPSYCEPIARRTDYAGQQLKEALLNRIWGLIRSVEHRDPTNSIAPNSKPIIDPICENMLLAICERTMTQLVS